MSNSNSPTQHEIDAYFKRIEWVEEDMGTAMLNLTQKLIPLLRQVRFVQPELTLEVMKSYQTYFSKDIDKHIAEAEQEEFDNAGK